MLTALWLKNLGMAHLGSFHLDFFSNCGHMLVGAAVIRRLIWAGCPGWLTHMTDYLLSAQLWLLKSMLTHGCSMWLDKWAIVWSSGLIKRQKKCSRRKLEVTLHVLSSLESHIPSLLPNSLNKRGDEPLKFKGKGKRFHFLIVEEYIKMHVYQWKLSWPVYTRWKSCSL